MGRLSGGGDTYWETEMREGKPVGDRQGQKWADSRRVSAGAGVVHEEEGRVGCLF